MHLRNVGPLLGLLERILNFFALDSSVSTYKDCGGHTLNTVALCPVGCINLQ